MAKKKQTAVKKPAKAARTPTVKVLRQEIAADVAREASLTRKHELGQARAVGKKVASLKHELAAKTKKAGLALHPDDVQCCAAQALAASLRLALGVTVHDEDMLALYWRTASGPDEGATILDTLEAAREYGLSGVRPSGIQASGANLEFGDALFKVPCILRLDLPAGPHAVTAAPDGSWWSWGEPYDPDHFGGAVITEAWAVSWS